MVLGNSEKIYQDWFYRKKDENHSCIQCHSYGLLFEKGNGIRDYGRITFIFFIGIPYLNLG